MEKGNIKSMIHCYQLTHQQQCMSKVRQRERHHPPPRWQATDSAPHLCGSEGNKSENQDLWVVPDPLPRWLAWEWQDNAILQANPFSNQLTRHHDETMVRNWAFTRLCSQLGWDEPKSHLETCPMHKCVVSVKFYGGIYTEGTFSKSLITFYFSQCKHLRLLVCMAKYS